MEQPGLVDQRGGRRRGQRQRGDGRALGILDWGGGDVVPVPGTTAFLSTAVGGVRLDAVMARWNAQGWGLSLVTGDPVDPVCRPEPPLPV